MRQQVRKNMYYSLIYGHKLILKKKRTMSSNADSDVLKNKNARDAVRMHREDLCLCISPAQTLHTALFCVACKAKLFHSWIHVASRPKASRPTGSRPLLKAEEHHPQSKSDLSHLRCSHTTYSYFTLGWSFNKCPGPNTGKKIIFGWSSSNNL